MTARYRSGSEMGVRPAAGVAGACMLCLEPTVVLSECACEASTAWLEPRDSILVGCVRRRTSSLVLLVMSAKDLAVHLAPS